MWLFEYDGSKDNREDRRGNILQSPENNIDQGIGRMLTDSRIHIDALSATTDTDTIHITSKFISNEILNVISDLPYDFLLNDDPTVTIHIRLNRQIWP